MGDTLEERLKSHARAFEGLMSLIPAKEYYGKDESITSTQWQKKKKQTLEERQAAKRAKLDPASHKSAKDVMDENARKRKRELDGEGEGEGEASDAQSSDLDLDIQKEKPLEGVRSRAKKPKTKVAEPEADDDDNIGEMRALSKAEAKAEAKAEKKREKRKEKAAQKKQKQEAKKAQQSEFSSSLTVPQDPEQDEAEEDNASVDNFEHPDDRIQALDIGGLVEEGQSTAPSTEANSNSSPASVVSAASSASSLPSSSKEILQNKSKKPFKIDQKTHENFQVRLNARLEAMRAARKADGPDGRPAKNRAELIEARRKKEAEKRAAKKISRQEAKEEDARQKAEEELARIRGGSGSPLTFPTRSPDNERNFNFGKVAWDEEQLQGNLSGFLELRKKKGKSDVKTALDAARKKQSRISGLGEGERSDIQEKDMWLAAKKRAQGGKVLNDVGLLQKTLKRQQKQKEKSKQEWKERLVNVQHGKEAKQKKREENLKRRREEKGQKGKKKVKKPGKKVRRPGFEGTFKAR